MDQHEHRSSTTTRHDWRAAELGPAHEIALPQGRLRYHDRGSGPAILFSHGWLANANLWRHVVARLADRHRCIVPDLPLGAHLVPMGAALDGTPNGIGRLLNDLVDALELGSIVLVGNDSGGAYAQIATAQRPERVAHLVLNACETPYDPFPPTAFDGLKLAASAPESLAALLAPLRDRAVRHGPAAFGGLVKHPIDEAVSDSYALPILEIPGIADDAARVMAAASRDFVAPAGERLIAGYSGPVTFIWPTEDRFFSLPNVRRYAGELQRAAVELVENAYAFTPEDQPARFAELLATALAHVAL